MKKLSINTGSILNEKSFDLKFPSENEFFAIFNKYQEKIKENMNIKNKFFELFEKERLYFALLNSLFGNSQINLIKTSRKMVNENEKNNNEKFIHDKAFRKKLLGIWLSKISTNVKIKKINFFF